MMQLQQDTAVAKALRAFLVAGLLLAVAVVWIDCCPLSARPTAVEEDSLNSKQDGLDDTTLAADFSTSAFGLEMYAQLLEPYKSYPCMPRRIHMSQKSNVHIIPLPKNESHFHNQTTEYALNMTVSFSLDYEKCANVTSAKIHYRRGFHPEETVEAVEKPLQFSYQSSIENITLFQSDWIYHVTLPNVKAGGHQYWYRIEIEQEDKAAARDNNIRSGVPKNRSPRLTGKTPDYSFLTAPLPFTPTAVALVGDLGQTRNSTKTMAHIFHDSLPENKDPTTLLLIAGDMAYADSDPMRWLRWFDLMEPLTRSLSMHVAAGNHEIECDNATNAIFVQYENYFRNPNRIAEADMKPISEDYRKTLWEESCSTPSEFQGHYNYGNAFYSFRHGYAHFIILSSYSDSREGSPQYNWLEKELKEGVNRTLTPWLVVSFHAPLYTTFVGHVNETQALAMKRSMEPLFNQYNVNLVINGHDHGYMRTHSISENATIDDTGMSPIYLTLGAGGNREMHSKGFQHKEAEDWVAKRDLKDYGYGNLLFTNATHALLNWVRDGVSKHGEDDKNVWIVNHHFNSSGSDTSVDNIWNEEMPAREAESTFLEHEVTIRES